MGLFANLLLIRLPNIVIKWWTMTRYLKTYERGFPDLLLLKSFPDQFRLRMKVEIPYLILGGLVLAQRGWLEIYFFLFFNR